MPRYEVAPTRTNLMRIKEDLEFALEGYELLEQKRDILVTELERFAGLATKAQQDVDTALAQAFAALREAKFATGESGLRSAGSASWSGSGGTSGSCFGLSVMARRPFLSAAWICLVRSSTSAT